MNRAILFFIILQIILISSLFALDPHKRITQYDIRVYTAKDGLPMNSLKKIFQDSRGYIWIGTQEGLVRFDGVEFKLYDKSQYPGLKCNFIWDIDEDASGNLWLATNGGGISFFDGFKFTTYDTSYGLVHNIAFRILIGRDSTIWIGTQDGLSRFKNGKFKNFAYKTGLGADYIQSITEDKNGQIYVSGYGPAVSILKNDIIIKNIERELIMCLYTKRSDEIILGSLNGEVSILNNSNPDTLASLINPQFNRYSIRAIVEDHNQNIWFCSEGGGIIRYNGRKIDYLDLNVELALGTNFFESCIEDIEGNLWFAGVGGGLIQLKDNKFNAFGTKEGLPSQYSHTVCEDHLGNIWVGFRDAGFSKISQLTIINYNETNIIPNQEILSVIPAFKTNDLFIGGGKDGLFLFSNDKVKNYQIRDDSFPTAAPSLYIDQTEHLWIGWNGFISQYINNEFKKCWLSKNPNGRTDVIAIVQTPDTQLWFGTYGVGLYKIVDSVWTQNDIIEELKTGGINVLYCDRDSTLWIGTDNLGLYSYKNYQYTNYSVRDGLFCDRLFSILEDDSLNLWCSTNRGIFKVSKQQLHDFSHDKITKITCQVYNHLDGMREAECNGRRQPSAWKGKDGRLWFTSVAGVVTIDPNNYKVNRKKPPVYIEHASSKDSTYRWQDTPIQLKDHERDLEIHYTALSFIVPERVRFKYQLLGYDKDWIEADTRRTAYYTNLPKGNYTFHVIACNNDGLWNHDGAQLKLNIPPYWWETGWAFTGYFITFLFIVSWIVWLRTRRVRINADLRVKEENAKNIIELDQTKSRFFAGVSHEFRTPLTLIKAPLQDLLTETKINAKRNILQTMLRNTIRLEKLVDELLDWSQFQQGKQKLQARPICLIPFLRTIIAAFESYSRQKNIPLTLDYSESGIQNPDVFYLYLDADKMEKVITNLLSNALKFTHSGGKVTVRVDLSSDSSVNDTNSSVKICVIDTGIGIPAHILPHLFDYFYRYRDENNQKESGTGIGLALSREMVKLHQGEIEVTSIEGQGSTFTITLLTGKNHLKPEEIISEKLSDELLSVPATDLTQFDEDREQYEAAELSTERLKNVDKSMILLVEDNPDMRNYLILFLSQKFLVMDAKDGQDGLNKAIAEIPDLIISDIMMPRMDGFQLCEKLKSSPLTSHIPIILLTAKGSVGCKIEGLEHGAVDYLTKPFDKQELLLRIQNLLQIQKAQ